MGFVNRAFVAAGVGFAMAAIAGCGSSGGQLLSQSQAARLTEQLNSLEQSLSSSDCRGAQRAVSQLQSQISALNGVNSTLIANLDQGATTIQSLASRDCPVQVATTPRKTHPHRTHTSTSTSTITTTTSTQTFTQTTTSNTTPSDTTSTTLPNTSTTGGQGLGDTTSTSSSTTTPTTGGQGLGNTDTTSTGAGVSTTGVSGTGGATGSGASQGSGNGGGF